MKILINLGSHLLEKALQQLLSTETEQFEVLTASDMRDADIFRPDFIVADFHTLRKKIPVKQPETKIVLIP